MTRSVASIDIQVGSGAQSDFTLESIYLYNSRNKGRLMPDKTLYSAEKPSVAGTAVSTPLLYDGADITTPGKASAGAIYTFEAAAGTTQDFRENTCLVIGGRYKNETTSYYRVDFREKQPDGTLKYLPLLGNYKYTITINSVAYSGWDTPQEAFNALPMNLEAEIVKWELGYDEEIDIGQESFTLSESRLVYLGLNDGEGTPFTGFIEIKSSKPWTYELSESAVGITEEPIPWIKATRRSNTHEDIIDLVIEENLASKRVVYIHFKTENLTHLSTVVQRKQNDPNCYIVPPGGQVEFPVRKVYMVWNDEVMGDEKVDDLPGPITCGVIWEEVENLVSVRLNAEGDRGNRSKLLVTASGDEGNAIVGVYINNILRYSWHIWVTGYDPDNNLNGTTYPNITTQVDYLFMDRNLGATTAMPGVVTTIGLLYQYGRKDPFPGPNAHQGTITHKTIYGTQIEKLQTPATEARIGSNNMHYTLMYPFRYYLDHTDWYTTQGTSSNSICQNNYLWLDEDGDKGMFDPCPEGWRVPDWTRNAITGAPAFNPWHAFNWGAWDRVNYGWATQDGSFYPAAGYIHHTTGNLTQSGFYGCYWTATPVPNQRGVYYVVLNSAQVSPTFNHFRSGSAQVRCVKDK